MSSDHSYSEASSLSVLPNELLLHILRYSSAKDISRLGTTCWRFHALANRNEVWRQICTSQFRYWNDEYDIKELLSKSLENVDWKELYTWRDKQKVSALRLLNSLISSQHERPANIRKFVSYGYNVKELLYEQLSCPKDTPDILARRHWAYELLGIIERDVAMDCWTKLLWAKEPPLEQCLAANDLCVAESPPESLSDVSDHLDLLARMFTGRYEGLAEYSTRRKAISLIRFLRQERFTGVRSRQTYRDFQNNFISIALCDCDHPALPLINAAIFTAVARRVGIDAYVCELPDHIIAIVESPPGFLLDGGQASSPEALDRMYVDPFSNDKELELSNIYARLRAHSIPERKFEIYLKAAHTASLVFRTSRNMLSSLQDPRLDYYQTALSEPATEALAVAYVSENKPNLQTVLSPTRGYYAMILWNLLFSLRTEELQDVAPQLIADLGRLCQVFENIFNKEFRSDLCLIEKYVYPKLLLHSRRTIDLRNYLDQCKRADAATITPKTRSGVNLQYRVGQHILHLKYGYTGVIVGWDPVCKMPDDWINQMGVDELSKGRYQAFYNVYDENASGRYVAEENISVLPKTKKPSEALMKIAGEWFKRWDDDAGKFVSNLEVEYPDD